MFDLGFVRFRSGDWGLRVFFVLFSVYWSKLLGGRDLLEWFLRY